MTSKAGIVLALAGIVVLLLAVMLVWQSSGCGTASANRVLVPEAWRPSLSQVQESVASAISIPANQNQQALNLASQNLADIADVRLFVAYVLLMQSLNEKEAAALFDEQKAWLARRAAMAREAVASKGGSLAATEYAGAFRSVTEARLADLESRLTGQAVQSGKSTEQRRK